MVKAKLTTNCDCGLSLYFSCLLCVFVTFIRGPVAEVLFHERSHGDQTEAVHARAEYTSYTGALHYLGKYGYLKNCSVNSRHKRDIEIGEGSRSLPECSVSEVKDALKNLQEKYKLKPSGVLDDATKLTLSAGRCGNSDTDPPRADSVQKLSVHSSHRALINELSLKNKHNETDSNGTNDEELEVTHAPSRVRREAVRMMDEHRQESSRSILNVISPRDNLELSWTNPRKVISDETLKYFNDMYSRTRAARRNRNIFHDIADIHKYHVRARRKKRSTAPDDTMGSQFNTNGEAVELTWRLPEVFQSTRLPAVDQFSIFFTAFRIWSEVIPPKFKVNAEGDARMVDILLAFGTEQHLLCQKPFDGTGGELAHSWAAGDIHFDEDENYKADGKHGINLLRVAVHEIGHVLGLAHTSDESSIMYPLYMKLYDQQDSMPTDSTELNRKDRKEAQKFYGVCKGGFNAAFDWLRQDVRAIPDVKYIYNTYFFRGDHYWMYENRYNRTRYGDPLKTEPGWKGIGLSIDAVVQVHQWQAQDGRYDTKTLFFGGADYFLYDDMGDKAADGYPRKIADDFGAKDSSSESVPDNIDAVLFSDDLLLFFKGEWVWLYNPADIGKSGCCVDKMLITELFRMRYPSDPPLTADIDTAYYSYKWRETYLLKQDQVYKVEHGSWFLIYLGNWYDIWSDICDVDG